jgi:hypothetical protein
MTFDICPSSDILTLKYASDATEPLPKIIRLDNSYDITLVVGPTDRSKEQHEFLVCTKTLKLASVVWSAMFSGRFAESLKSEVHFPEDSPKAFLIVLQIAHFKSQDLPESLSKDEMYDLAIFCDKYELGHIVLPYILSKEWLLPFKEEGDLWRADVDLKTWIYITSVFKLEKDWHYLVCRLAMIVSVDETGTFCRTISVSKRGVATVELVEDLPVKALCKESHSLTSTPRIRANKRYSTQSRSTKFALKSSAA